MSDVSHDFLDDIEDEKDETELKEEAQLLDERKAMIEAKSETYQKLLMASGDTIKYHYSEIESIRSDEDYLEYIPKADYAIYSEKKLSWQPMNIPKSLTKLATDTLSDTAVQIYKAIMEYAGDVQYPYPNTRARYILQTLAKTPELTEEVFLQFLKALSDNSNNVSEDRTWGLFCMVTHYIAPTEESTPYILNYLLAFQKTFGLIGNYATLCMKQIEARLEIGTTKVIPDQDVIEMYSLRPPILANITVVFDDSEKRVMRVPILPTDKIEQVLNQLILPYTKIAKEDYFQYGLFENEIRGSSRMDLRKRLTRFYTKYNKKDKLEALDFFIETWGDNPAGLFRKLETRYGPEPNEFENLEPEPKPEPKTKTTALTKAKALQKTKTLFKSSITAVKKTAKKIGINLDKKNTFVPKTDMVLKGDGYLSDVYLNKFREDKVPTFALKRKLFKSADDDFNKELLLQAKYDFFNNNIVVNSLEEAVSAITIELILRNELQYMENKEELKKFGTKSMIPIQFLADHQPEEVFDLILVEMNRYKKIEIIEKNLNYTFYELCQKQVTHNMTVFSATERNGKRGLFIVGVNKRGINFLTEDRKKINKVHRYINIKEYASDEGVFVMTVVKQEPTEDVPVQEIITFKMKDAMQLYSLVYDYTFNSKQLGLIK